MTREHKVIGSFASIPVRVPVCYEIDVIFDDSYHPTTMPVGDRHVDILDNVNHTYRYEICMSFMMMLSHERAFPISHFVDKMTFDGVYAIHWPDMGQGKLPFLVCPYLEPLHHLDMTPEN